MHMTYVIRLTNLSLLHILQSEWISPYSYDQAYLTDSNPGIALRDLPWKGNCKVSVKQAEK